MCVCLLQTSSAYWLCGFVDAAAFVVVWKGKPLDPAPPVVLPTAVCSCCQMSSNTRRETGWMGSHTNTHTVRLRDRVNRSSCVELFRYEKEVVKLNLSSNAACWRCISSYLRIQPGKLPEAPRRRPRHKRECISSCFVALDLMTQATLKHNIAGCYLGNVGPLGSEGVPSRCVPLVSCSCPSSGRSGGRRAFPSHAWLPWAD